MAGSINALPEKEKEILLECLRASLHGPFFPDWEFQTLFGIERSTLAIIESNWPNIDLNDQDTYLSIHNSLLNLWGYPHRQEEVWDQYISASVDEINKLLEKIKSLKNDNK